MMPSKDLFPARGRLAQGSRRRSARKQTGRGGAWQRCSAGGERLEGRAMLAVTQTFDSVTGSLEIKVDSSDANTTAYVRLSGSDIEVADNAAFTGAFKEAAGNVSTITVTGAVEGDEAMELTSGALVISQLSLVGIETLAFSGGSSVSGDIVASNADGGFLVDGIRTAGDAVVSSAVAGVTLAGSIVVGRLDVEANGDIDQDPSGKLDAASVVTVITAGAVSGDVILENAGNMIAAFEGASSVPGCVISIRSDSALVLGVSASSGVSVPSDGEIQIAAAGSVTQLSGGQLSGGSVVVTVSAGDVVLTELGNNVSAFAATSTASASQVAFTTSGDLVIGVGTTGIASASGLIEIQAAGSVTQAPGTAIVGDSLFVSADGEEINLSNAGNAVALFEAVNAGSGGGVTFSNSLPLIIGDRGIQTAGGSITVTADGAITVRGPLEYAPGSLTLADLSVTPGSVTFVVTTQDDSGAGSLRDRLANVQDNQAASQSYGVVFDAVVSSIALSTPLASISRPVTIDGEGRLIEIAPLIAASLSNGLVFADGAQGSRVASLSIGGFSEAGVRIETASVAVVSSAIGVAADGTARPNGIGVLVSGLDAQAAVIGEAALGNRISGNATDGVRFEAGASGALLGNTIGLGIDGTAMPNGGSGVSLDSAGSVVIGGSSIDDRNVISGNAGVGILVAGDSAGTVIEGNWIGLSADGEVGVGNGDAGIRVTGANANARIGGTGAGAGNVISGNLGHGVEIAGGASANEILANVIGLDAIGAIAVGNAKAGVAVLDGAASTTIGRLGYGNVISGNAEEGVSIASTADTTAITGNTIGLTLDGDLPVGNGKDGVFVDGAAGTTITANIISGNAGDGIGVEGAGAVGTEILGNIVGLNAAGDAAVGNKGVGIAVVDVPSILIGGGSSIERNVVSGNGSHGIVVTSTLADGAANSRISSNYVGLDASGTAAIGNAGDGVRIDGVGAVSATIVSNVVTANAGAGIRVTGDASSAVISANTIGLDAAASAALGNEEDGVRLEGGSGHLVGGNATDANVVAGNLGKGIVASATDAATIAANIVGTNLAGASGLGNSGDGIVVDNAVGTTIRLNLSSGNGGSGVSVSGDGSSATAIVGNFIGTGIGGITALPNSQHGVSVSEATGTTIGGATAADRNIISGNIQKGVSIASATSTEVVGNYLGVTSNGYSALGNAGGGIAVELATDTTIRGGNIVAFNGSDADGHGIAISASAGTVVGSEAAGLTGGNAIYRNRGDGVRIADGSTATVVVGNAIGTTSAGVYGLGNEGAGIAVIESNGSVLGGLRAVSATDPVLGNLIVGNSGSGIAISDATPGSGDVEDGNRVQGNTIRWHGGAGVFLARSSLQMIGGSTRQANEIIQNSGDGVAIDNSGGGAGGHVVSGNAIGTDVSGSLRLGNAGDGISIRESVANTISGGNVIAYNRSGVVLVGVSPASSDEGNVVAGNTISSNVGDGVRLEASTLNTIGAIGDLPGNSIVFNGGSGVSLAGGSSGNLVAGNLIGTDSLNRLKSNARQGVLITASEQNEILGNTIAWNSLGGVRVVGGGGNVIGGIDADANAIRSNGGTGVVLAGGTVGNYVGGNMVRGNATGGIAVSASSNNRIDDGNVVVKNQKFGISVTGGSGNSIDANFVGTNAAQTAQLGNLGPGIMVNGGVGTRVGVASRNVVRFNGGDGIQFTNVSAATADDASAVSSNVISSNTGAGISVTGGALVAITDNIVGGSSAGAGNGRSGIVVGGNAADVGVTGNSVLGNAVHGVELVSAIGTMVGGVDTAANRIEGNRSDGIHVAGGSRGVVIGGNAISANRGDGIEINASIGNRVEGATITSNGAAGVTVVSAKASSTADGNVISGATIDSNAVGISILGSSGTSVIDGNTISRSASAGILVGAKSSQTVIESNTISDSRGAGVEINASRSTAVRDNQVTSGRAAGVLLTQASGTSAIDGNTIEGNEIVGNAASGITLVGSSFNALSGNTVYGNRGHGIALRQASNANSLLANDVGDDATRAVDGNVGDGIRISGSFSNVIGQGNNVSGNAGAGVSVLDSFAATSATGNRIEATTIADNGGAGVVLNGGAHVVGGAAGLGNTITGNAGHGVAITAPSGVTKIAGAMVAGNTIQSNGGSGISLTGVAGTAISGNSIGDHAAAGIALVGGTGNRIESNVIGGDFGANVAGVLLSAGAAQNVVIGNTVSANEGDGIAITGTRSTDNLIGVRSVGTGEAGVANKVFANLGAGIRVTQGIRNQVAGNSISKNVGGGIVLQDGGNSSQPSPTLTSARRVVVAGRPQLQVTGEVRGAPRQRIVVDLYRNDVTDGNPATGLGYQARAAIGRVTVMLDATGRGTFTTTLSANVPAGDRITAVATTASGVVGNASQQSAAAISA